MGGPREIPFSEGDVNLGRAREKWRETLGERARSAVDADQRYFLRQALSTPYLTEIVRAEGAWLTDADRRRYLDFHGNSVAQARLSREADESDATRRYRIQRPFNQSYIGDHARTVRLLRALANSRS
jgi:acetylornithine/succinyldiaminopimelate/putrescine aminotransferase